VEHAVNVLVLLDQKRVLSSSDLDRFTNFWEHCFDSVEVVLFGLSALLSSFLNNNVGILLILENLLEKLLGLLVTLNEVNDNLI
jgi:hypothetical protein